MTDREKAEIVEKVLGGCQVCEFCRRLLPKGEMLLVRKTGVWFCQSPNECLEECERLRQITSSHTRPSQILPPDR